MVGARVPGCRGCAKTAHGGRVHVPELGDGDRYEVRQTGKVLGRFRSVVAAATFATGHPGATVHTAVAEPGVPATAETS